MRRSLTGGLLALVVACGGTQGSRDSSHVHSQAVPVVSVNGRADSAQAFVQRFYEWYLITAARHGSAYDSLLTSRRALLGDSLFRALSTDIAIQRADTVAEIASLTAEADVFLNSQDPCDRYVARTPRHVGGDTLAVVVAGTCSGLDKRPNIEVLVRPSGASWQIENIKDPERPSFDLVAALKQYHVEAAAPASATPGPGTHRTAAPPNVSLQLTGVWRAPGTALAAFVSYSASGRAFGARS